MCNNNIIIVFVLVPLTGTATGVCVIHCSWFMHAGLSGCSLMTSGELATRRSRSSNSPGRLCTTLRAGLRVTWLYVLLQGMACMHVIDAVIGCVCCKTHALCGCLCSGCGARPGSVSYNAPQLVLPCRQLCELVSLYMHCSTVLHLSCMPAYAWPHDQQCSCSCCCLTLQHVCACYWGAL